MYCVTKNPKSRPKEYLRGFDLKLKQIDLDKIREAKKKEEKIHFKNLAKIARKNKDILEIANVFSEKFLQLAGNEYKFRPRVLRTEDNGKQYIVRSDIMRLNVIFTSLLEICKTKVIAAKVVCKLMDDWAAWDKACSFNLVGFLETLLSRKDEIGVTMMKLRKNDSNRTIVLNSIRNEENVEQQRKLFG